MIGKHTIGSLLTIGLIVFGLVALAAPGMANEVNKGEIPSDHLNPSCKALPWGAVVWDLEEAVASLKANEKVIWIDTRPDSFFQKGSVRSAVLLPYDKSGAATNALTPEKLEALVAAQDLTRETAKIAFFCQGPKCHRSYNAAYMAASAWGYTPQNIIWFRAGYPNLFKDVKADAKLRRRAKAYLSDNGLSQL